MRRAAVSLGMVCAALVVGCRAPLFAIYFPVRAVPAAPLVDVEPEHDAVTGLVADAMAEDQDPVGAIVRGGGRYYRVPTAASLPAAP